MHMHKILCSGPFLPGNCYPWATCGQLMPRYSHPVLSDSRTLKWYLGRGSAEKSCRIDTWWNMSKAGTTSYY